MRSISAALILSILSATSLVVAQAPAGNQTNSGVTNGQSEAQRNNQIRQAAMTNKVMNIKPAAPSWLSEIHAEHKKFIDDLLDYWQTSSDKVKRYQCEFVRYEYDTAFCNWRDPRTNRLAASAIMTGEIRFAAPDKACYETLHVYDFAGPPEQEGQDPKYSKRDETTNREKWICDGKNIFEFDYENKKLYETQIPLEMQGKGLVNSPIPFLFGASKDDILNRYWVRIITPNGVQDEYWLEAVPKKIDDSRNYSKLELVISRNEFLPIMLHVYAPNYNPKENNFSSRVFEFKNRKVNSALAQIQDFFKVFVRPSTPIGWDRVPRKALQNYQQFAPPQFDRPAQRPSTNQVK
jgi:TIGR03009 family protein